MDLPTLLNVAFLGSLIVPTIVVAIGLRQPTPRSRYAAALAWGCAWVGQLVVPMGLVAVACAFLALTCLERGYLLTAFAIGPLAGALATLVAVPRSLGQPLRDGVDQPTHARVRDGGVRPAPARARCVPAGGRRRAQDCAALRIVTVSTSGPSSPGRIAAVRTPQGVDLEDPVKQLGPPKPAHSCGAQPCAANDPTGIAALVAAIVVRRVLLQRDDGAYVGLT